MSGDTIRVTAGVRVRVQLEELEAREVPALVGGLDPSFATAGTFVAPTGPYTAVATQADGKVVVVGSNGGDFLIVRFNANGTPDTTFNGTGVQKIDFLGAADAANDVAIQADGKIVVVGSVTAGGANGLDFGIARLNTDGTLDGTFGTGGKATLDFAAGGQNNDTANGVAVAGNGNIYLIGTAQDGLLTTTAVAVAFTPTGTPLGTFGNNGKLFVDYGGTTDTGTVIDIQADGKLIFAGTTNAVPANGTDFAVSRHDPTNGMLDMGFGNAGKVTINFGAASADRANTVAVQANGNIVVAGSSNVNAPGNFDAAVARLTPAAGALDAAFGTGGKATVDFGGVADTINDMAIQTDGNLLFVGTNDADAVVARLSQTNGAFDPSFNGTGKAVINVNGLESGNGIDLLADGRIVVAGTTNGGVDGFVSRLIGTVEKGQRLGVSGQTNGTAQSFTPVFTTGQYNTTPAAVPAIAGFTSGNVRTAVADVNGDFIPDTVIVTGPGTPIRVAVISGADNSTLLVQPFDPFGGNFTGGGFVAAADVNGDGVAEFVVTPDQGGGPRVSIFRRNADGTTTTLANFLGIDDVNFRGGARAALGDVNNDGVNDLAVAAGFLGGPRTALFDGKTLLTTPTRLVSDFFAFPGSDAVTLRNGVFVSIGDVNGDGFADLMFGGGPGGAPRVFVLSGALVAAGDVAGAQAAPVANFFVAGNSSDRGGVRVAATDADGDNKAELAVGSGEDVASRVRVYLGKNFTTAGEPATFQDLDPFGATLPGGVFVG